MQLRNILAGLAILVLSVAPLSAATTVTLTGGCQLYLINSSRSYITFDISNTGDGTASNLLMSAAFPGISPQNSTLAIPNIEPDSNYTEKFYFSSLPSNGSYAVNINATYAQSGSTYATVFPCVIYVGSLMSGPLREGVSISGSRMSVNVTNTAQQSITASVRAVVPQAFSVKNPTGNITVGAGSHAAIYFDISSPAYTNASFPVIGELSYDYGGSHYAQIASAALVFGSGVAPGGGGIGLIGLALVAVVAVILILIVASIVVKYKKGGREVHHKEEGEAE